MKLELIYLFVIAVMMQFLLQKVYDLGWVHGHMKAAGNLSFIRACTETDGAVIKYNGPRWKKPTDPEKPA